MLQYTKFRVHDCTVAPSREKSRRARSRVKCCAHRVVCGDECRVRKVVRSHDGLHNIAKSEQRNRNSRISHEIAESPGHELRDKAQL